MTKKTKKRNYRTRYFANGSGGFGDDTLLVRSVGKEIVCISVFGKELDISATKTLAECKRLWVEIPKNVGDGIVNSLFRYSRRSK